MEKHAEERFERIERIMEETKEIQATNDRQIAELRLAISEAHVDVMKLVVGMGELKDAILNTFVIPKDPVSAD